MAILLPSRRLSFQHPTKKKKHKSIIIALVTYYFHLGLSSHQTVGAFVNIAGRSYGRAPPFFTSSRLPLQTTTPINFNDHRHDSKILRFHNHYHHHARRQCITTASSSSSSSSSSSLNDQTTKTKTKTKKSKKPNPASPHTTTTTPRLLAVRALTQPKKQKQKQQQHIEFAVRRLENDSSFNSLLDRRDRSLARLLVTTVERRMGQIDVILGDHVDVYPPKKGRHASLLQSCLRVGVAQLIFLDIAPHAAIKETVEVLRLQQRHVIPEPMIKFCNAVLRTINRKDKQTLLDTTSPRDNVAPWLLDDWDESWGTTATDAIIERCMMEPRFVDISTSHLFRERDRRLPSLMEAFRREFNNDDDDDDDAVVLLPHGTIRLTLSSSSSSRRHDESSPDNNNNNDINNNNNTRQMMSSWPGYDDGSWWVQDASAALPALALRRSLLRRRDDDDLSSFRVLDACAAPGGKTAQLLSYGFGTVVALEMSERRCRRLVENLDRLGYDTTVVKMNDGGDDDDDDDEHQDGDEGRDDDDDDDDDDDGPPPSPPGRPHCEIVLGRGQDYTPHEKFDAILLDVPCSATGTGRKRPDVLRRLHSSSSSLQELTTTQYDLAIHAIDHLLANNNNNNSLLVYATCSLLRQEGEDVVSMLLQEREGVVETLPFERGDVPGFDEAIDENGWLRVLPGMLGGSLDDCDGFFVAQLVKV